MFSVGVSQRQSVGFVCRRLHNGELSDLYCSTILWIWFNEGRRKNRWRWAFGKFGVRREGNRILVVIRMGRKPLGIFRHRWDDDIDGDVKDKGWSEYVEWNGLSELRGKWLVAVGTLMNICISKCVAKFVTSWGNIRFKDFSARSQLLTSATRSLSTQNQMYYRITNRYFSTSSTNSTQCPLYCPLYAVFRYSERLLHCTFCSVFCQFQQPQ